MVKVHSHSEITIRRPGGAVEVVRHPAQLNTALFARITAETRKAGRGECLSYTLHTKMVAEPTGYAAAVAAERVEDARVAAIYRAMDAQQERAIIDNTPAHPNDY